MHVFGFFPGAFLLGPGTKGIRQLRALVGGRAICRNRFLIGIGGRLATPPLPHHRAYGSRTTAVRPS